jgi:hypothetical protein
VRDGLDILGETLLVGSARQTTPATNSRIMQSQSDDETRVLYSTDDLDDYDILSTSTLSAAVPHHTTESFRRLIWGAIATYRLGNESVDHVLRRYDCEWRQFRDGNVELPQISALRSLTEIVNSNANLLESIDPGTSVGRICAKSAFCRLEASFKAAFGLVRRGYLFETEAVARLVLEQLAWSLAAYQSVDDDVFNLNPTKCINRLTAMVPDAGPLYKELTEGAHIDPEIAKNYLKFHATGTKVVRRSIPDAIASGQRLLLLGQMYLRVAQKLFGVFSSDQFLESDNKLKVLIENYST